MTTTDNADTVRQPMPTRTGEHGERYLIRGGAVLSMDAAIGDLDRADILIEGRKIIEIDRELTVNGVPVIEAAGRIVMPGFVDTHHHLFETALRGFLPDGLLVGDGTPHGADNYMEHVLGRLAPAYRPEDVYLSTLFGALSQLDAGVTTALDVSQIHHSREHSDASVRALADAGGRGVFGYFESSGGQPGNEYPADARRLRDQYFSSSDQLLSMVMGGEIYLPDYERAWELGRELDLPVVAHVVGGFGIVDAFDQLATSGAFGPDNLFIHMTEVSDTAWRAARDAGAGISMAVPTELLMGHGTPPILKAMEMGIEPSLSSDVETTLTADSFTQMRSAMAFQRGAVHQMGVDGAEDVPELLTVRDMLRWATTNGAKDLKLDDRIGSLAPGREADIVILDAEAINVAPVNDAAAAVVSLMDRSNVESVIVGGSIRKWKGRLVDIDLARLRGELDASRDRLFEAAGTPTGRFWQ